MLSALILYFGMLIYGSKFHHGIIFNDVPFTVETIGNYKTSFQKGEKIYWLFMSKKPIKAQYIEVQVLSANHKTGFTTISGIAYTHDYRINKDCPHYYTDYFVFYETGAYEMRAYSKDEPTKLLTTNYFYIK